MLSPSLSSLWLCFCVCVLPTHYDKWLDIKKKFHFKVSGNALEQADQGGGHHPSSRTVEMWH